METLNTLIGPFGWLGWALFVLMGVLYVHLWRSSGPKNLRKLNRQLAEASTMIGKLQEENMSLQNRNDYLRTQLNTIQQQLTDDRKKLVLLAKSNGELKETIGRMSLRLQKADEQNAEWYKRVVKLETLMNITGDDTGEGK